MIEGRFYMIRFFKENIEPRIWLKKLEVGISVLLCIASIVSIGYGLFEINAPIKQTHFIQSLEMTRDVESEDYSEDNTICDVTYTQEDKELVVSY